MFEESPEEETFLEIEPKISKPPEPRSAESTYNGVKTFFNRKGEIITAKANASNNKATNPTKKNLKRRANWSKIQEKLSNGEPEIESYVKGLKAEKMFELFCIENRIPHYNASSPADIVDCVINLHGELQRVQIKYNSVTCRSYDLDDYARSKSIGVPLYSGATTHTLEYYSKDTIDLLITLVEGEFYSIPVPKREDITQKWPKQSFCVTKREDYYNTDLWKDKKNGQNRGKYDSTTFCNGKQIKFLEDFKFADQLTDEGRRKLALEEAERIINETEARRSV